MSNVHGPLSLSPEALGADRVQVALVPVPVEAWALFPDGSFHRVRAEAIEWTRRAIRLVWPDATGRKHDFWVWGRAVTGYTSNIRPRVGMTRPGAVVSGGTRRL
jgi:hypothetical protein